MRRSRFRWLVVGTIVAVGLYFAADVVALQYLESRGATELARAMTAEEATMDLGTVPFLPSFLAGRLSRAEVSVRGASAGEGLRVQSVHARLSDLRFSWRSMLSLSRSIFSTRTTVRAADPFGAIEIGQADLGDFLSRHVQDVESVKIAATGIEVLFEQELPRAEGDDDEAGEEPQPVRLLPRVEDGRIVLSLVGVSQLPEELRPLARRLERRLELPRIPDGLRPDVRLGDGVIVVEATGTELELVVGEGEES